MQTLAGQFWVGRFRAPRFGPVSLLWGDKGLVRLTFGAALSEPRGTPQNTKKSKIPAWLADPLGAYFAGNGEALGQIETCAEGTPFQEKVWAELRKIPAGSVRSYGAVAASLGNPRAMRAVGMANGANPVPIVIPCHRVIQAGHKLGGYTGGLDRKIFLLTLENVTIDGDLVRPGQLPLPKPRRSRRGPKARSR